MNSCAIRYWDLKSDLRWVRKGESNQLPESLFCVTLCRWNKGCSLHLLKDMVSAARSPGTDPPDVTVLCLLLKVLYSVAFPHLFGPIYPPTPLPPSDLSWTYCAYQCLLAYALPVCPPNAVCSSAPTPGVPGLQVSAPVFSAPSVCSWCLQLTSIILWALKLTPVLFRMFN